MSAFNPSHIVIRAPMRQLIIDVRIARILLLRMSYTWDDNGDSKHDHGDWADAWLIGHR
jgi:hypothetical protein